MPPVDIGCAASGSQSLSCTTVSVTKVQCVTSCLKTHKVRYQIPPFEDFRHTCGGYPGDDRRTNSWGTDRPLKWATVPLEPTLCGGSSAKLIWISVKFRRNLTNYYKSRLRSHRTLAWR